MVSMLENTLKEGMTRSSIPLRTLSDKSSGNTKGHCR